MATNPTVIRSLVRRSSIFQIFFIVCTNPISSEFYDSSTCRCNGFFGRFGEGVRLYLYLGRQRTPAKDLHAVFACHQARVGKHLGGNLGDFPRGGQLLQCIQVDSLVFYLVKGFEPELGNATLQRHLSSFETDLPRVARPRFLSFMSSRGSTSLSRTGAAPDPFAGFGGSFRRF